MTDNEKNGAILTRRNTLRLMGAAGAGYVGWRLLGGSGGPAVPAYDLSTLSDTPKRGGHIRVASIAASTADTLDPAKGSTATDYIRHNMIYSGLTRFNEQLEALPALAEVFSSDDQATWYFRLRDGVTFHDGKSLHADDVVYSLMRHKDKSVASKVAAVAQQFVSARSLSANEVELQLDGPNADLPKVLATSHFLILQNNTTDFSTAAGTGPYTLQEFIPGVRTIVERNESYWVPGKPYLDSIELIGISDETARVNSLLSGDVQMVLAVNPRSIRQVEETYGYAVKETPSGLFTDLIMRVDNYPGNNPDFINAMKYLFDRDVVKRALFRGYATVANDHPVPPNHPFYNTDLPQREYDPDRAAFLLKRAGLGGARLPLFCSPAASGSVDMAALLQLSAAEAGLKLGVNRMPADGYWSNHWGKHPLSFGNVNPRPSLDLLFSIFFKSDAPWNLSRWNNPQFDQLLLAARAEGDQAKRKQMYYDMQTLVHDHSGIGIPVFMSFLDGYDQRIGGLGAIPVGGLMGYAFAEHVWWRA